MKIMSGSTFGWKSAYWTNDATLNPSSPVTQTSTNAKYGAFNTAPFNMLRMCVGSPKSNAAGTNCVTHKLAKTYNSARTFFAGGYVRDATLDQEQIESAFASAGSGRKSCGMQVYARPCRRCDRDIVTFSCVEGLCFCCANFHA